MVQGMNGYSKPNKGSNLVLNPVTETITGQKLPGAKK
jgi:hypothetical protein